MALRRKSPSSRDGWRRWSCQWRRWVHFSHSWDMQWDCSALITLHIRVSPRVQDDIIVIAAEEKEHVTLYSPTVKQNLLCVLYIAHPVTL